MEYSSNKFGIGTENIVLFPLDMLIVFLPFGSLMRWPTEFTASTAHPSVFFALALIDHSPASNGTDP